MKTNLKHRVITRGEDLDYFILTEEKVVEVALELPFSRLQFPNLKAVLVRTTPINTQVTIHFLADTDLQASIGNITLEQGSKQIAVMEVENKVQIVLC